MTYLELQILMSHTIAYFFPKESKMFDIVLTHTICCSLDAESSLFVAPSMCKFQQIVCIFFRSLTNSNLSGTVTVSPEPYKAIDEL